MRIFICYRHTDGKREAEWLNALLLDRDLSNPAGSPTTAVYFDGTIPAVEDWTRPHRKALEEADGFVVIVTPGLCSNLGPTDWVHRELDWWIANGKGAPIVLETTGEGERWIPRRILKRWPRIQRIEVRLDMLSRSGAGRARRIELRSRIVEGINANRSAARPRKAPKWIVALAACVVVGLGLLASLMFLPGDDQQACEPGGVRQCACPGSCTGTQTCTADGSGYSACDCYCAR